MAEEDQKGVWPPAPVGQPLGQHQTVDSKQTVGRIALFCSSLGLVPFILVHGLPIRMHSTLFSLGGVPLLLVGLVLGLTSLSTPLGRVALIGPLVFSAYVLLLMLHWYGVIPL